MTDEQLRYVILGAAFEVHRELGPGLLESAYEACLSHLLVERGLHVQRQVAVPLVFRGHRLEEAFRVDLWVERRVIVEVKAITELGTVHRHQLRTYLRLTGTGTGLLINFNTVDLREGIRRVEVEGVAGS